MSKIITEMDCATDLSEEEIKKYNKKFLRILSFGGWLEFSSVPTEKTVPICQMVRKAMRDLKKTLNFISFRGLKSDFLSNELVLGISLELLSEQYPRLTTIDLSKNQISNVSLLADAMRKNSSVTEINLSNNKIKNADPLARSLLVNNTLTKLNLSDNLIENVDLII